MIGWLRYIRTFTIAAPTGKAARRIREATGYPAQTIHKLLEFNRPEMDDDTGEAVTVSKPNRGRSNPIDEDVVVVDEYAMVSTGLHRDLVDAIGTTTQLRVFGDIRQLPPIENNDLADPTSPFAKCLAMPNTVTLHNIYRQEEGNGIIEAARRINRGEFFSGNTDVKLGLTTRCYIAYTICWETQTLIGDPLIIRSSHLPASLILELFD